MKSNSEWSVLCVFHRKLMSQRMGQGLITVFAFLPELLQKSLSGHFSLEVEDKTLTGKFDKFTVSLKRIVSVFLPFTINSF